ncbi:hypothetical protein M9Y10_023184 [Tritrichomonas musculus]|uniref:Cytoplasmic tRNA 2-thiolation protein 2 n=1 Tax=Tritrichomonas musculus TaxID=1915356 RepID=A0ABR2KV03_9EUKA
MTNEEGVKDTCIGCHQEKICYSLRKGVIKCADCICDQVGKSTMDLFRKATRTIPNPVHVLVSISGGASSLFLWDLFKKRLGPYLNGKSAVVRKLEGISSLDIPNENSEYVINKIPEFTISAVIEYAKTHDFNCVVLGDNTDHATLANFATLSCGRPDLAHWYSTDDSTNYIPVTVSRPVRQCLLRELQFYCKQNNIKYDASLSKMEKAFPHEIDLINHVLADENGAMPFAVQKLGEKLPPFPQAGKCPICNLPSPDNEICSVCSTIESHNK